VQEYLQDSWERANPQREQAMRHKAYEMTAFEREPGRWRTSISRTDGHPVICQGVKMKQFTTSADAPTEEGAIKLAKDAIDGGYVK
jgi:hypothetical protein